MSLFYQPNIKSGLYHLDEDESRHCIKVLRHQQGDHIEIVDGLGTWYKAKIIHAHPKKCAFEILESRQEEKKNYHIHLVVAPTKSSDRMEWLVEKAVEIGIDEISFVQCQQSERKVFKTERVQRKALSAMKQSLKYRLPKIHSMTALADFLSKEGRDIEKYIAYVDRENPDTLFKTASPHQSYCILIGPEGDFSSEELQLALKNGFQKVSLGRSRLRTETAALAACLTLNLINE